MRIFYSANKTGELEGSGGGEIFSFSFSFLFLQKWGENVIESVGQLGAYFFLLQFLTFFLPMIDRFPFSFPTRNGGNNLEWFFLLKFLKLLMLNRDRFTTEGWVEAARFN